MRRFFQMAAAVVVGAAMANGAWATMFGPTDAPVDRVIQNLKERVQANPDDPAAYYTLARAHYLAFYTKLTIIPIYNRTPRAERGAQRRGAPVQRGSRRGARAGIQEGAVLDTPAHWQTAAEYFLANRHDSLMRARAVELALQQMGVATRAEATAIDRLRFEHLMNAHIDEMKRTNWQPAQLDEVELLAHAQAALENFKTAIRLQPEDAVYRLGLAALYEQYVEFRPGRNTPEPAELAAITLDMALQEYFRAFSMKIDEDRAREFQPAMGLQQLVSYEAGQRYAELIRGKQGRLTPQELDQLQQVRTGVAAMDKIPRRGITPIVLSLEPSAGLAELVDDKAAVEFDVDGDDVVERWSWVRPETGVLVWDPEHKGEITSGRQMFGGVTWWLFFRDGYEALDTLDDNRDGRLAGGELIGLAVWFDRNSNGKSEPGEVVPIERLPIASLATHYDGMDGISPRASLGLTLDDGRTLPTYDWIAQRTE